ncbi:endonuclease domain-containing protein [Jiella endophytica]|uniref:Endonuclease domain-containing protein n=1 Tax=Jiella endophytica TaxID=2558362 RepID=A0A4Y8RJA9_9HYPH|nr:endonuclease domain-containing protein [Jiella endophytica]TFF21927.1 endonuclease domain-containing protein [Jiella endophytica]
MPTRTDRRSVEKARQLRKSMTEGEKRLWHELKTFRRHFGVHFRKQVPIGPYVADFAAHYERLIVEVDGEFHHYPDRMARDAVRDAWLNRQGYRVLRFSTGDIEAAFDGCVEEIMDAPGLKR